MTPVIALGDIHGQLKIFPRLTELQATYPGATTVFIGDYVDGHPGGFAVLHRIQAMQAADPAHTVVLMGNHDAAMAAFFADGSHQSWLNFGGRETLSATVAALGLPEAGTEQNRRAVRAQEADLLDWVGHLPLQAVIGKLRFVHAGYDLLEVDPIAAATPRTMLWIRNAYFYGHDWGVFGHNPLPWALVTGHTGTGFVQGRYAHDLRPAKRADPTKHPIYTISYPGEMPRYLLDGGIGPSDLSRRGNVAVFDADTGQLIDAIED